MYGLGRWAADGPATAVPEKYTWMPTRYGDLSGEGKGAIVVGMREFLDGTAPGDFENSGPRWFSPENPLPGWDGFRGNPPDAVAKLRMAQCPEGGGPRLCRICADDPSYLKEANDLYFGQSFPELNILTECDQMCVSRARALAQVYSVRSGKTAYVGHDVNLEQKGTSWYENHPPRPRELPVLPIIRPPSSYG